MDRILKYSFIAGIAIGALAASIILTKGCSDKTVMEPAEVVEAFTKAVATGRFEDAAALCDTSSMSGYIGTYRKVLNKRAVSDSTATAIAASILGNLEVTVNEVSKSKGTRTVFYTIADTYGHTKEKIATIKNVEGEWKVTEIRDRN